MNIAFIGESLQKLEHKLKTFAGAIGPAVSENRELFLLELLKETRLQASGRPGPNIVTGRYYANFMIVEGRVVNPSPQTARLEYGFVETDSAGRMYHQPAFPHFRPALAIVGPKFKASFPSMIRKVWRES